MPPMRWCRELFRTMADGGVWGVPRSGLLFQKRGGRLVLIDRMPHMTGMPCDAAELRDCQDGDFSAIVEKFAAAGIEVIEQCEH